MDGHGESGSNQVDANDINDGPEKGEAPYVVRVVEIQGLGSADGKRPVQRGKGRSRVREWRSVDDGAQKRVSAFGGQKRDEERAV